MILTLLLLPLLAGALVAVVGNTLVARLLALAASGATFIVALNAEAGLSLELPWLPQLGANVSMSFSGAGLVLVTTAAFVLIPTIWYAGLKVTHRTGVFLGLIMIMQAFLNGMFMAQDLLLFYVSWEAALIPSVIMLGVWGGSRKRQAAMKYLMYAVAGSFLMLVAIISTRVLSGAESFHISDLLPATAALSTSSQVLLFLGFTAAFAVKLPLFPLHAWLPDFHEQNHPSGAADVAGTLYKAGGFGFFAWAIPLLPAAAELVGPVLLAFAAFTALYAGLAAIAQRELKRLLAYASLSHMGIIGAGLFSLQPEGMNGAMLLLAAQMVSTSALFLLAGMLGERRGTFDLDAYGGLARSAPALAGFMLFALFASIGVPGLANFPGEFLSLLGAFMTTPLWGVVATLAVIAAGVYGVNLYQRLFQGEQSRPAPDLRFSELLTIVPFALAILWFGLSPKSAADSIAGQTDRTVSQLELAGPDTAAVPLAQLLEDAR